jgi:hypothetical protein
MSMMYLLCFHRVCAHGLHQSADSQMLFTIPICFNAKLPSFYRDHVEEHAIRAARPIHTLEEVPELFLQY